MTTYKKVKILFSDFFIWLFRIKVKGIENIPKDRAILFCPNHISNWDPFLLAAITDVRINFMAKKQLFKVPLIKNIVSSLGAFPVNRGFADPTALKTAINLLKTGNCVGIFPQGTRYRGKEPKTTSVKAGVGMIAYRSGVDVLPVAIKTKKYKTIPFRKVYINIGKPIANSSLGICSSSEKEYQKATEIIFDEILKLIEEI